MIIPKLVGGLGNQLFQIASSYGVARKSGFDLFLNYDLEWFCMTDYKKPVEYKQTLYKNIPSTDHTPPHIIQEESFSYSPILADQPAIMEGYFQSPKYFDDYREEVKNLFCFDSANDCSHLVGDDTIGVHIRRGDYLNVPTVHGILDLDYYKRALDLVDGDNVVICTDDPDWAETHFGGDCQISNFESEVDDLYLLSQCKKVILSNSSFSWWGAYLGKEKETVIVPSVWFGPDGPSDYSDIYVKDWRKFI